MNQYMKKGVLFKKACVVDAPVYLKSLWQRVISLSSKSKWIQQKINNYDDLLNLASVHDQVVVAAGTGIEQLWLSSHQGKGTFNNYNTKQRQLPFKYVRGQNLIFESLNSSDRLTMPLLKGEYLVPSIQKNEHHQHIMIGGATHEYANSLNELNDEIDLSQAKHLLLDKLTILYPNLSKHYKIIAGNAGIRVMPERSKLGKIPVIEKFPTSSSTSGSSVSSARGTNVWFISGLGARGLIHHALQAQYVVQAIVSGDESVIPLEMRFL